MRTPTPRLPRILARALLTGVAGGALLLNAGIASAAPAPSSPAPLIGAGHKAVGGEYIVVLKGQAAEHGAAIRRQAALDRVRGNGGTVSRRFTRVINGFTAKLSAAQLDKVRRSSDVAFVQPNLVHHQAAGGAPAGAQAAGAQALAGGTQTGAPWHLDRIDQRNLPLNKTYRYGGDGAGVHAYVIDSGIRSTHTEFEGRVVRDYSSIADGRGTEDCANHGTFVSSEVGGKTYGVAKKVTLHAVRILTCQNTGTTDQIVAGMDWVATHHQNPNVANMSIQSDQGATDTVMDQAAAAMIDAGVHLVLIAGNFNSGGCTNSPKDPRALIVGATSRQDARWTQSNYGRCVDVWAPGNDVTGAGRASDTTVLTGWSGTSMAAPIVSGVGALALQANPNLTMQQLYDQIIATSTRNVLTGIGTSPNRLVYSGTSSSS